MHISETYSPVFFSFPFYRTIEFKLCPCLYSEDDVIADHVRTRTIYNRITAVTVLGSSPVQP